MDLADNVYNLFDCIVEMHIDNAKIAIANLELVIPLSEDGVG